MEGGSREREGDCFGSHLLRNCDVEDEGGRDDGARDRRHLQLAKPRLARCSLASVCTVASPVRRGPDRHDSTFKAETRSSHSSLYFPCPPP